MSFSYLSALTISYYHQWVHIHISPWLTQRCFSTVCWRNRVHALQLVVMMFYINFSPLLFVWVVDLVNSQTRSFVLQNVSHSGFGGLSLVVTFTLTPWSWPSNLESWLDSSCSFVCFLPCFIEMPSNCSFIVSTNSSYPGSVRSTWSSPDSFPVHLSLALLSWYLWHSCYFFSLLNSWPSQIRCFLLRGSFFLLWLRWLLSSLEKPFLTSWAGQIFPLNAPIESFHSPLLSCHCCNFPSTCVTFLILYVFLRRL